MVEGELRGVGEDPRTVGGVALPEGLFDEPVVNEPGAGQVQPVGDRDRPGDREDGDGREADRPAPLDHEDDEPDDSRGQQTAAGPGHHGPGDQQRGGPEQVPRDARSDQRERGQQAEDLDPHEDVRPAAEGGVATLRARTGDQERPQGEDDPSCPEQPQRAPSGSVRPGPGMQVHRHRQGCQGQQVDDVRVDARVDARAPRSPGGGEDLVAEEDHGRDDPTGRLPALQPPAGAQLDDDERAGDHQPHRPQIDPRERGEPGPVDAVPAGQGHEDERETGQRPPDRPRWCHDARQVSPAPASTVPPPGQQESGRPDCQRSGVADQGAPCRAGRPASRDQRHVGDQADHETGQVTGRCPGVAPSRDEQRHHHLAQPQHAGGSYQGRDQLASLRVTGTQQRQHQCGHRRCDDGSHCQEHHRAEHRATGAEPPGIMAGPPGTGPAVGEREKRPGEELGEGADRGVVAEGCGGGHRCQEDPVHSQHAGVRQGRRHQ
jgi:hypothetical protein